MAPSLSRGFIALALVSSLASANAMPAVESVVPSGHCTTTAALFPTITFGPVYTVFTATTTATRLVDCGDCDTLAISHVHVGPGPVVFFTTTVTATTPAVTTVLKCGHQTPAGATPLSRP